MVRKKPTLPVQQLIILCESDALSTALLIVELLCNIFPSNMSVRRAWYLPPICHLVVTLKWMPDYFFL